jgi:hypothetical protein
MVHQEPQYTKDLNLWIVAVPANAEALLSALQAFGAPIVGVLPTDLTQPEVFFQIGVEPVRVDILTSVPGLDFASARGRRVTVAFGGVPAPVISWPTSRRRRRRRIGKEIRSHCCPRRDGPVTRPSENTRLGGTPVELFGWRSPV